MIGHLFFFSKNIIGKNRIFPKKIISKFPTLLFMNVQGGKCIICTGTSLMNGMLKDSF